MPAPRKPKKVLVQFAIALVVAIILGVGALVVGFGIITNVTGSAESKQKELLAEKEKLEAEKKRLQDEQLRMQSTPKTFKVVQAVTDLTPGQPITQEMVTLVQTPDRPMAGTLSMLSQAVGKMVKLPIMKGEPIEMGRLLDAGGFINVQDGMRAITIQVDAIGGLNGSLIPGAHVDVLTTVAKNEGSVTRTLLQDIPVITVGEGSSTASGGNANSNGASKSASSSGLPVTLVVTPRQAELLTLANTVGAFHLTLRNFGDKRKNKMTGADITSLMTGVDPDALGKHAPSKPRMPIGGGDGFHNVNYSPDAMNLPAPSAGAPAGSSRFSMQIYRGTGSETMDFQQ